MRFLKRQLPALVLLLNLCAAPLVWSQGAAQDASQANRRKASELFSQGRRLEALPLLEEAARANPQDADILVALAACLVEHANTLPDQAQAAKERFRARDLLQKAWNLGNTSPLAESLLQLLGQLPENGAIRFSEKPEVQKVMAAGEAAFARRDFDEAIKNYAKALELEPANYSAALFTANTYDRKDDIARASDWYRRAIQIDPDVETAWRYYADMMARKGDMAQARALLIGAAAAEPYNRIVWRELRAWATLNKTDINFVYVGVPQPAPDGPRLIARRTPEEAPEVSAAWQAYHDVKARWKQENEFGKRFPQEKEYRHSLAEESEALTAAARILQKLAEDKNTARLVDGDQALSLLVHLHQARLMEAYVLFSLGDAGIGRDYSAYRKENRSKLEEYMDKFVVPGAR